MKTINAVSIWDNGQTKQASVLNTYAVNVSLGNSATFWYGLLEVKEDGNVGSQLAQGNISMSGDDYTAWQEDTAAWDFIAASLGLTITGDYVAPVPAEEEVVAEEEIPAE